ncbi:MAG: AAA family ATPase [Sulfurovum sp.]
MKPLDRIYKCIDEDKSFVLQGGAGSGKTETLKQTLQYISKHHPNKKVACITHTNLAVNEIKERVGDGYTISTIHSFLHSLIKDYKKNIHQVMFELFKLEKIERLGSENYTDAKEQNKKEHDKYKDEIHYEYASKLYTVKNESADKVIGKREYDKNPDTYNSDLNSKIDKLNEIMQDEIEKKDFNQIEYNDTKFESYKDLTYGHDGLLEIASLLFIKYPILKKILQDKYDLILIDEYQDTHEMIIDIFIYDNLTIGLFGDSMQSIYEDGVGEVKKYINTSKLEEIIKEDNYRCSEQVIEFINKLRNDTLKQEVALKKDEKSSDRQGNVKLFYSIYEDKPNAFSNHEDKNHYLTTLSKLIGIANEGKEFKNLMLTNKSISKEVNFQNLYEVFYNRYPSEPKEKIDSVLSKLQYVDLYELCNAYETKNYNLILKKLKKNNFAIKSMADKKKVTDSINEIINSELGAIEILQKAFDCKLIKKVEKFDEYLNNKAKFLESLEIDDDYKKFKSNYLSGNKTYTKMKKITVNIEEEVFNELQNKVKKEIFYMELFSDKIKFHEIINYFKYINEETEYITMHKTKGSSIKNVTIVLDEYFWSKYNFKSLYVSNADSKMKIKNQKLFYVACSRAEKNLNCVRLINSSEEKDLLSLFPDAEKIEL